MPLADLEKNAPARAAHLQRVSLANYGLEGAAPGVLQSELADLVSVACTLAQADYGAVQVLDGAREICIAASDSALLTSTPRVRSRAHRVLELTDGPFVTADARAEPAFVGLLAEDTVSAPIRFYGAVPLVGLEGVPLGVLSVWSTRAASISESVLRVLEELAERIMQVLHVRRASTVRHSAPAAETSADPVVTQREWNIDAVIAERAIRTLFQPIVHLSTGATVGYKAVSYGPADSRLESPAVLIEEARKVGRIGELDWLCRVQAMEAARNATSLHPSLSWFIGVEPESLRTPCPELLVPALAQAATDLRVILDIASPDIEAHLGSLTRLVDQSRRNTWGIALQDVGILDAPTALRALLEPDVIRLHAELLIRGTREVDAASVLATLASHCNRSQATLLVEGIATAEQKRTALMFGAEYGQGDYFGQPSALPETVPAPRHVVPLRKPARVPAEETPFELLSGMLPVQRATEDEMRPISEYVEQFALAPQPASVVLANLRHARHLSDAEQAVFTDVALANTMTIVLASDVSERREERLHVLPTPAGSKFADEWLVIVLSASHAVALSASGYGSGESQHGNTQLGYVLTHDRELVIRAARCFLREAGNHANAGWFGEALEPEPEPETEVLINSESSSTSRNRKRTLLGRLHRKDL